MKAMILALILLVTYVHGSPTGSCPATDPKNNTVFLPDDAQCNKYHLCEAGVATEYSCPEDLHFNPELSVCDYPESAACVAADANDTNVIATVRSSFPRPHPSNVDWLCRTATHRRTLVPNPWNRHKFFRCDHGHAIEFACPADLVFNNWHQACEYPHHVEESHKPHPHPSFNVCKYASPSHFHFGDPWDTHKFIECDLNTHLGFVLSCPAGLEFNPFIQVCDWPHH